MLTAAPGRAEVDLAPAARAGEGWAELDDARVRLCAHPREVCRARHAAVFAPAAAPGATAWHHSLAPQPGTTAWRHSLWPAAARGAEDATAAAGEAVELGPGPGRAVLLFYERLPAAPGEADAPRAGAGAEGSALAGEAAPATIATETYRVRGWAGEERGGWRGEGRGVLSGDYRPA